MIWEILVGSFIFWPWLALMPAFGFLFAYVKTKQTLTWITALIWLAYFGYEQAMQLRILCSGECNIRVDLVLIYPVLLILSVTALSKSIRHIKTNTNNPV
jgi:hypothetical protein